MQELYHVTPLWRVSWILKLGLIPRIWSQPPVVREHPGVVLFPSREAMEAALGDWARDLHAGEGDLASLVVTLPEGFPLEAPEDGVRVARQPVPPGCIQFFRCEGEAAPASAGVGQ